MIWCLVASISLEQQAYQRLGKSDFDYHWVGGFTNTTASVVVTVQPYRGNTLVEFLYYIKLYLDQGEVAFPASSAMSIQLVDPAGSVVMESQHALGNSTLGFKVDYADLAADTAYGFVYWDPARPEMKHRGSFTTFPTEVNAFSVQVSSCARTMTDNGVYEAITAVRNRDAAEGFKPLFFANIGDLHYAGTTTSQNSDFQVAYHEVFKSKSQRAFYKSVSLVYTLDDHDAG